jgi:fructose-bisphosphate aldolase class I
MNAMGEQPWELSFSYGRALQSPALEAWHGDSDRIAAAQAVFCFRAKCNGAARYGKYSPEMEQAAP